ncbi:hypothetical protein Hypma_010360 [Hypsizygus marmoreus]|uniref:Uncharacterized protein n=1 Tax=Hypsizygus marmoreus TaxID=39966 RepID=A0A369JR31_HYPMA|nr:hypothetical protein Hypma_010360 [Hypsizygus marmoreus]
MPRILPRLLANIAHSNDLSPEHWTKFTLPHQKRKSLHKPVPARPSFNPAHHKRSILLAPAKTNPIISSRAYVRHKTLPPRPRLPGRVKTTPGEYDRPRKMTDDELRWWSSPYLRMLASPLRQCIATARYMPTDFLIRLGFMRVPTPLQPPSQKRRRPDHTVIPDGLQHPKFSVRRSGRANYVLCNRFALPMFAELNAKRFATHGITVHALLADHIAHLLRVRVLQELELLGDSMEALVGRRGGGRIVRRLSREEWREIRETGIIPFPNAVAVLVVPPLQKDPVTKKRPEPSMSTSPLQEETITSSKPALPITTLHPAAPLEQEFPLEKDILPQTKVPLYNGVALFPARPQRAALHALLTRLLGIERSSRHSVLPPETNAESSELAGDKRASHAFLLCSDAETARRADVAAVAIALWRVRMFEDSGEDTASQIHSGWLRRTPSRRSTLATSDIPS